MSEVPGPYLVLGLGASIGLAVLVPSVLLRRMRRAGMPPSERRVVFGVSAVALLVWLGITSALGAAGVYLTTPESRVPVIAVGLVVLLPIYVLAMRRWDPLRRALLDPNVQRDIVALQFLRCIGAVFLVLWARGRLPAEFGIAAGSGDVLVGVTAPLAALTLRGGRRSVAAVLWNVVGIADLVMAVTLGFLSAPPLQMFGVEPSLELVAVLPLVLIPTFGVPLALAFHVASLRYLLGDARPGQVLEAAGKVSQRA